MANIQVLDQNTCLPSCVPEGPAGFGTTVDVFGVSWTFEKGMPGPMVTVGTKLLDDIDEWRDVVKIPDPKTYDWEGGAARDTAGWDRENKIQSVIVVDGLFEQLHAMTGIEDALCYLLTDQEETYELIFLQNGKRLYIPEQNRNPGTCYCRSHVERSSCCCNRRIGNC